MSKKAQLMLKRAADTVISSFLLIVLTPVFVVTALAIKLTSRGPVFFIQGVYVTIPDMMIR
jgi:lipopolysaccharide/colanic/teichoic acid biosynthesis glycosyltransferase